jgi:NAD-dependent deacetylase
MQDIDNLITRAARLLRQAAYTVALTGAGHSTPSGIPDFRSPESGLWTRVDPLAVASLFAFRVRPKDFYDWIRPLARVMLEAQPNPGHHALAQLEKAGLLKSVITQNIDGLHQRAGSLRVHEVHGHMREATCIHCYRVVPAESLIEEFLEEGQVPRCTCGGVMKPNVILFGEQLPLNALTAARQDTRACDLMLVIGSSLTVEPVSDLPLMALGHGAKLVIVNYQPTHLDERADVLIHADLADVMPRIADVAINS